jgi:hypothetical protein
VRPLPPAAAAAAGARRARLPLRLVLGDVLRARRAAGDLLRLRLLLRLLLLLLALAECERELDLARRGLELRE